MQNERIIYRQSDASIAVELANKVEADAVSELEEEDEEESIRWINIIFLPFQFWWQMIILCAVITKCVLGPIMSVFPFIRCPREPPFSVHLEFVYSYLLDPLYIIDTFLYILHRQISDEAMKKEHLPKPAYQLMLDIISLLPLFTMFADDLCANNLLWPNLLNFNEFLLIYRVAKIFSLNTCHKYGKLLLGYTILLVLVTHALACLYLLFTFYGFCPRCGDFSNESLWYDWRRYASHGSQVKEDYEKYRFALLYVMGYITSNIIDVYKPINLPEIAYLSSLIYLGYIISYFIIMPKLFAENLTRLKRIYRFQPRIKRIVEETKRRNPMPSAYLDVESFYSLIWSKRHGIISMPRTILELPENMRLDLRQDLVWPVFHHSPTFKRTTTAYRRWLCQHVALGYKQPGERFFTGPHCYTNLYYIKSGVVQLLSSDDTTSPLLSLSGGTLLGDISFLVPPINRKVIARCLTYCEVLSIARATIVTSLHKFPEDRRTIMRLCRERLKHAHDLFENKEDKRGADRTMDEGIAWVKSRWWEIFETLNKWKLSKSKRKFELPPEETNYHCPKYIGQLVLCRDLKLRRNSLFVKVTFPWILTPVSKLLRIWNRFVLFTVALAFILLPPNIVRQYFGPVTWTTYLDYCIDIIYTADVVISLMTGIEQNKKMEMNFVYLVLKRCKKLHFILDALSTPVVTLVTALTRDRLIQHMARFNRLLKSYMLFVSKDERRWSVHYSPLSAVVYTIAMFNACFLYFTPFFLFIPINVMGMPEEDFYSEICYFADTCYSRLKNTYGVFAIAVGWLVTNMLRLMSSRYHDQLTLATLLCLITYVVRLVVTFKLISALYLKYRERVCYQFFVSNLKNHYISLKIHPDLLKRLESYLNCHWKYYNGMDILRPNLLRDEPFDIYWKLHGDIAEKIIGESPAFRGADSALVKELAHKSKFLILPQNSTVIMFGVEMENVSWIASGVVKCEYNDEQGELIKKYLSAGAMLAMPAVFLGRPPLRTYSSATDVEMLYMNVQEFFAVIRRYPVEWAYFKQCEDELAPAYDKMFIAYVKKNRNYQKKIRQQVFHARKSIAAFLAPKMKTLTGAGAGADAGTSAGGAHIPGFLHSFRNDPESTLLQYWMAFRAIIVFIKMIVQAILGASIRGIYEHVLIVENICDTVRILDVFLKFFVPYYDERGLVISKISKCALHYLTRSFVVDFISIALGWPEVAEYLLNFDLPLLGKVVQTCAAYLSIYLLTGYLDYVADTPSSYSLLCVFMKWQIQALMYGVSLGSLLMDLCVDKDSRGNLVSPQLKDGCWFPPYFQLKNITSLHDWHLVFMSSLSLVQSMFMGTYNGRHFVYAWPLITSGFHIVSTGIFWYLTCFSEVFIILAYRGDTLFQHGISQLKSFLVGERVEKEIIHGAVEHFSYWWKRTDGVDMRILMNERVGVVFRQDLCYYFFKRTFQAADTLLRGGEALERQLASCTTELYHLAGEDVLREMDLCANLFIVHRGRIALSRAGQDVALLTKGCIFGQLEGVTVRPVRVTARAVERADLLMIPIRKFQQIISNKVRQSIASNPQSKLDYMAIQKAVPDNPYNSIEYLLRGSRTIQLPWMKEPKSAEHNVWYARWLLLVWTVGPLTTAFLVSTMATKSSIKLDWMLVVVVMLDILHALYVATEYYSMELTVVETRCVYRAIKWRMFKKLWIYLDLLSLVLPYTTVFLMHPTASQLTRLVRLYTVYLFQRDFCGKFEAKNKATMLKVVLCVLTLHAVTCGYMRLVCMAVDDFPYKFEVSLAYLNNLGTEQWNVYLKDRGNTGCPVMLAHGKKEDPSSQYYRFVTPAHWTGDYLISSTYILFLLTNTNLLLMVPYTMQDLYYKTIIWHLLYLMRLWMSSVIVSFVYTKYREMYHFDYNVKSLLKYLKYNDVSKYLLEMVQTYTDLLWKRQSGNWLPEITYRAPQCLQQDILSSLYIHHLLTPPLFQHLPLYFLRQLAVKLKRVVVFPGKYIVQEGDINPCIYFIHEGEVEKWYTDRNGDSRMAAVLVINGVFGIIPGLFPNTPYQHSYYTRTVVDLVYLDYNDWQDLLDGYPDVKYELYVAAMEMKREHLQAPSRSSLRSGPSRTSLRSGPSRTSLRAGAQSRTSIKSLNY